MVLKVEGYLGEDTLGKEAKGGTIREKKPQNPKNLIGKHGSDDSTQELLTNPDTGPTVIQVCDDHLPIPLSQKSVWEKVQLSIVF